VVSWAPGSGAAPALFLSEKAKLGPGESVRGGIPVCFPQFGPRGPLPQHGFCRRSDDWVVSAADVLPNGDARAVFSLVDTPATRASPWPHPFALDYEVVLTKDTLSTELRLRNTGGEPLQFTCALHSYFAVGDVGAASVVGLQGCEYEDSLAGGRVEREAGEEVRFPVEVDRVYGPAPRDLAIVDRSLGRVIRISKDEGFPDAVVWNPAEEKARAMADMEEGGHKRFVCVEVGAVRSSVQVAAGGAWSARQVFRCEAA